MSKPSITVLMPAYNVEKYISEAVESVLAQTFNDFELLIVNDGSTDGTLKVIEGFSDPRIRVVNKKNGGVSCALNEGLRIAEGRYVARFDADDICFPQRLEKQFRFMEENPDYILVGSDLEYITEEGEYIFTFRNPAHTNEEIQNIVMQQIPFVHSSVMYRRDPVLSLGGYEIKAHTFEDYFLWTRLVPLGKVCNLREPLIRVRFHPSSVTIDEKDYEPLFSELKQKALRTGRITDEEGELLRQSVSRLNRKRKKSSYSRMLAKKFLWNNYQPRRARRYLLSAISAEPLDYRSYLLMLFSFLPEGLIRKIYLSKKQG